MRRYRTTFLAIPTILLAAQAAHGGIITSTWTGPSGGTWNDAANWDTAVFPNNSGSDQYHAIIDLPGATSVDLTSSVIITSLTLGLDDMLTIDVFDNLRINSSISGPGTILIDATGGNTYLRAVDGPVTISGGSEIVGGTGATSWILGESGGSLVNADGTIRGRMRLGNNSMTIDNDGVIDGDSLLGDMDLDPTTMTNTGTIRSSGGGQTNLQAGDYANDGGVIEALPGSITELKAGAVIEGGTVRSVGDGDLRADGNGPRLDSVTIEGTIRIPTFDRLYVDGTIDNTGTIMLDGSGGNTYLHNVTGDTLLTGGGTVAMGAGNTNWFFSTDGTRLINVDNTIRGGGRLGNNANGITNQSLIVADVGNDLIVDPGADGLRNTGSLRADAGATLQLVAGDYDNTGGVIEAMDASVVELANGAVIAGGTLQVSGSGEVRPQGNGPRLDGSVSIPMNAGFIRIPTFSRLYLNGTINNADTIRLDGSGGNTYLHHVLGDTMLVGGGTVEMGPGNTNWIQSTDGTRLVNVDNTIRGGGRLGNNANGITNDGMIIAEVTNDLIIDPNADGFANTGTLRAQSGATLRMAAGDYDNSGGVIEALDGSVVELAIGVVLSGGTLQVGGSGEIRANGNGPRLDGSVAPPTNTGLLRVPTFQRLYVNGTVDNPGTIALTGSGGNTYMHYVMGDTMLTGGGTVSLGSGNTNWLYSTDGSSLINVDNTIRGAGILLNNGGSFTNEAGGTLLADQSNPLTIDPSLDPAVNLGLMQAANGGTMRFNAGNFSNAGTAIIDSGAKFDAVSTDYTQTGGSTTVNGELEVDGVVALTGGVLDGNGLVDGVLNNASVVAPGDGIGTMTVDGFYTQLGAGTLLVEIGGLAQGTEHDFIHVIGPATLAGTLKLSVVNGFTPQVGDSFTVLMANTGINGAFQFGLCEDQFQISYTADSVVVTVVEEFVFADLNCDGLVNVIDLLALLSVWGPCDGCAADLNNDLTVNVLDLLIVLANWS